jgi:protein-disulfide isomerase
MRVIATFLAGLALSLSLAACQKPTTGQVSTEDMSQGPANAKVTIVEYASLGCPHCASWTNEVYPQFKAKYIDTGRVHYVLREALTGASNISAAGFLMARCAGKDKYFQVVEAAFKAMPDPETVTQPRDTLLNIAKSAGLSEQQFNACVTDDKALTAMQTRVDANMEHDHVSATPTFIINGTPHDGVMSLADLDAAITAAEQGKPIPAGAAGPSSSATGAASPAPAQ